MTYNLIVNPYNKKFMHTMLYVHVETILIETRERLVW
jgi:hypothetical protein